jgi:uncharacterized protein (DUF362 family)
MSAGQTGFGLGRRSFLQLLAANSSLLAARNATNTGPYYVGVGYSSDPYTASYTAITASGQFPTSLAGQTVVIKPNLVAPASATTGTTTDPHVVQAIVDLAIAAGATDIQIVEAAQEGKPSNFTACGYTSLFAGYSQVQLVDLRTLPYVLAPVQGGVFAFQSMWVPSLVMQPNTYFISAAKLKTHKNAVVTLSMKNLVGLGSEAAYYTGSTTGRQDLHFRGISESIVDLNLTRSVQFAVIDGVWGMQGEGPTSGQPVATNVVLAGLNAVAVDRVGLDVMEFPQTAVPYLEYATQMGLGPSDTSNVTLLGNSYVPYKFKPAQTAPIVWAPVPSPSTISLSANQTTTITYNFPVACYTLVDVIQDSDQTPGVVPIRTLHGFTVVQPPGESVVWDAKNNSGQPVTPGTYLARVQAVWAPGAKLIDYATRRITVTA